MADKPKESKLSSITPRSETQKFELLNDKAHVQELTFKVNGKSITINERELSQLLQPYQTKVAQDKEVNKQNKDKAPHPTQTGINTQALSQHGLKSARDVIAFLKSPGGKTTEALAQDHAAMLLSMRQQHTISLYRRELLKLLFRANHRLLKIARRRAEQRRINAINQRLMEKSLAYGRAAAQESATSGSYAMHPDYAIRIQMNDSYALSAKFLEEELAECYKASQLLADEMLSLEEFRIYLDELHLQLEAADAALDRHEEDISLLSSVEERIAYTETQRKEIKMEIKQLGAKIQELLQKGNQTEAKQSMYQLDRLNILSLGMKTMLDVYLSDKSYYDAEANPVLSYKNACYAVSKEQRLYKDKESDKLYLLEPGQQFNDMSVEEKAAAHNKFEQNKPGLSVAKQQIKHYVDTNNEAFKQASSDLFNRCNEMQKRILSLTKEQMTLKSDQAKGNTHLDAINTELPTPRPTPQPIFRPALSSYRHALQLMRLDPTPEAIRRLKTNLPLPPGALLEEAQKAIDTSIKPHTPITSIKMNSLLASLERLGVSVNKHNVTSTPSKHPNKLENQNSNTAPTPFKTTPSPFKY